MLEKCLPLRICAVLLWDLDSINPEAVSGQSPPRRGKRTVRNFGAVYCVVGDVLLSVVKFVASCSVVCGFVGWRVAVYTRRYSTSLSTHFGAATSAYNAALALYISCLVCSLS
jgi:hypothetical protein